MPKVGMQLNFLHATGKYATVNFIVKDNDQGNVSVHVSSLKVVSCLGYYFSTCKLA